MAQLAAYTNVPLFTVNLTAVAVARGVRLTQDSSDTYAVSAIGVRGDAVAITAGAASAAIAAGSPQAGGIIPLLASEAIVVGDTIYSAASGKASKTSGGGAVILGKAKTAASGDGVLFECLLENPV